MEVRKGRNTIDNCGKCIERGWVSFFFVVKGALGTSSVPSCLPLFIEEKKNRKKERRKQKQMWVHEKKPKMATFDGKTT